jgi:hypothetical protein
LPSELAAQPVVALKPSYMPCYAAAMLCRYHAKLPLSERVSAHREFQRDDASVMVASLAFGMGIDKPNIRRIIHYVSVNGRDLVCCLIEL